MRSKHAGVGATGGWLKDTAWSSKTADGRPIFHRYREPPPEPLALPDLVGLTPVVARMSARLQGFTPVVRGDGETVIRQEQRGNRVLLET